MGIKIGDKNKIKNATIINGSINKENVELKQSWFHRHPFLTSILASMLVGIILLLSFWDGVIKFIEQVFGG